MTYSPLQTLSHARARALTVLAPIATAVLLGACTGEQGGTTKTTGEPSVQAGDSAAGTKAGGMQGMEGMHGGDSAAGMAGGMSGMGGMDADMQAHMQRMAGGMSGEQMRSILPTHRQMVANMLSRMNGEMRQMNMAADAAWTATVDSLRQDLVRMPELSAAELTSTMPAHMARVRRLAEMHQTMMKNMK